MSESIDTELSRIIEELLPIVKVRVTRSIRRSPENLVQELETLASLYVIRENLPRG